MSLSKLVLLIMVAGFISGCATANIKTVSKTGAICEASYASVAKDMSNVKMSACHASGEAGTSDVSIDALINILQILKGGR